MITANFRITVLTRVEVKKKMNSRNHRYKVFITPTQNDFIRVVRCRTRKTNIDVRVNLSHKGWCLPQSFKIKVEYSFSCRPIPSFEFDINKDEKVSIVRCVFFNTTLFVTILWLPKFR